MIKQLKTNKMKNFRLFVLLALMLMVGGVTKAQQWRYLQTGVAEDLYNVCCIDDNTIFVCGQNGVILKSTDSGAHWAEKYRRTGCQMTEICFADANNGYAVCDSILDIYTEVHQWFLVKTYDGGETWNEVGEPILSWVDSYTTLIRQFVRAELFLNDTDNLVVAVSFDGIYKSTDGGATMRKLDVDFTINETRGIFFEDNVGYLLWDYGNDDFLFPEERCAGVAKTEDYGETWSLMENISDIIEGIAFAHFYDKDHLRLFGEFKISDFDYKGVLETYDGFDTFEASGHSLGWWQFAECYIRAKFTENDWGVSMLWEEDMPGVGRAVAYTEDDGLSWTDYSGYGLPTYRLYDIDGTDTTFYISCAEGEVLKNRQFTLMGTGENVSQFVTVYPNPVKDNLNIDISGLPLNMEHRIQITDALGYICLDRIIRGEGNVLTLGVSGLKAGLYAYRIYNMDKEFIKGKFIKE